MKKLIFVFGLFLTISCSSKTPTAVIIDKDTTILNVTNYDSLFKVVSHKYDSIKARNLGLDTTLNLTNLRLQKLLFYVKIVTNDYKKHKSQYPPTGQIKFLDGWIERAKRN